MTDKNLTDNEIKKALDYWKKFDAEIDEMMLTRYKGDKDLIKQKEIVKITFEVFDLINRLQAQVKKCEKVEHFADKTIATLQAENEDYKALYEGLKAEHIETIKAIKHCKAEAYKEFAEKAENKILPMLTTATAEEKETVCFCLDKIKNLLKELVGEDNESEN